jgi:uncharacterized protein (TIGR02231 family)
VLSPGDLAVELTYTVSGVSWQPIYDLRLVETGEAQPVLEVDYLAQVTQRSGEAWQDVTLALSTARPALAGRLPQLDPWFIGLLPPPIIHADMAAMPAPMAAPMRAKSIQAAPVLAMEEAKADNLEAEIETQGAAVTYRIPANVSIPADGAPHKVAVTNLQFEPQLDFVTAPKLVDAVFRRAKVTNNSPFTFLPGAANLFAGSEFIGTMHQEMIPPQGKIELFLGVDDRLKVKRELKRREVDKKLIGSKRRIAYGYEITVENLLPRQARLTLHDQFPVSKHEDIKVRLEDVSPQPAEQSELHLLKWEFDLAAQEKRQVRFDFSVEYPPVLDVVGLP